MKHFSISFRLFVLPQITQPVLTSYGESLGCLTHSSLPPVLVLLVCLHQMDNEFSAKYEPRKPANESKYSPTAHPLSPLMIEEPLELKHREHKD